MSLIRYLFFFFFLMIRRPPRSTLSSSSAASDVYKRQPPARAPCSPSPTPRTEPLSGPPLLAANLPVASLRTQTSPPTPDRRASHDLRHAVVEAQRRLQDAAFSCPFRAVVPPPGSRDQVQLDLQI
eukprot:TRINITY_DN6934_c0_g1_i6.p1 TRINITY_DN6934_c0_g1~~TRINITY_DN6934_c0_g1_i6.p1  ORF type:complete len:126 (-),score=18.80 TRINITY_DN6934_c0_g1_i6:66-443(-)